MAIGLSPIPIVAVVVMLSTPRARSNGPAFALGWVSGLVVVCVVVLAVAGGASDPESTTTAGINWLKVAVGVLFLVLAAKQWRKRPRDGQEAAMPSWMSTVDSFSPAKSLGLGVLLSALNPKNLALAAAGAAAIAQEGLSAGGNAAAVAVFVLIASSSVLGLVAFYLIAADRAASGLASIKDFMAAHDAVIMMVVLLVLGAMLLGQGLGSVST